jgi:hypothetical protein
MCSGGHTNTPLMMQANSVINTFIDIFHIFYNSVVLMQKGFGDVMYVKIKWYSQNALFFQVYDKLQVMIGNTITFKCNKLKQVHCQSR